MLTTLDMQCAHVARQVSLDPTPPPSSGDAEVDAQFDRRIVIGQAVLKEYTLTYSRRYRVGTTMPSVPEKAVGFIGVDAGHIATQKAHRLAIFKVR